MNEWMNKWINDPVDSGSGILYSLGKVHKDTKNELLPYRPFLSAIGRPTYKLAAFLLPFLTTLSENEHTVLDRFHL